MSYSEAALVKRTEVRNSASIHKEIKFWIYQFWGWVPFFLSQQVLLGNEQLFATSSLLFSSFATLSAVSVSLVLRRLYRTLLKLHLGVLFWLLSVLLACLGLAVVADVLFHGLLGGLAFVSLELQTLAQEQPVFSSAPFIFINFLAWSCLYLLFKKQEQYRNETLKKQQVELLLKESEVKNLQAQLNPHFLFNTLNNIRALVLMDGEKAREALYILADIMRYQINYEDKQTTSIVSEMQFVRHYVALAKLQFGERLVYDEKVDEALLDFAIPRFAIQLLIENAIKHGFKMPQKCYQLSVRIEGNADVWCIQIKNSGKLLLSEGKGVGLDNLRRRLAFQFGHSASFNITQVDDMVAANITFNNKHNE